MILIMLMDLYQTLAKLAVQTVVLSTGEYLFHRDDAVRSVFLVEDGQMALIREQEDGGTVLLNRAYSGTIIAEASLYSDKYHCSCLCEMPSRLLRLPLTATRINLSVSPKTSKMWAAYLAAELQNTRFRCELLTRNKVSDRLLGWIEWHGKLPPKGNWKALATEIGVTPEALYREIKKQGLV